MTKRTASDTSISGLRYYMVSPSLSKVAIELSSDCLGIEVPEALTMFDQSRTSLECVVNVRRRRVPYSVIS